MPSRAGTRTKSAAPKGLSEADLHPTFEEWKAELAEVSLPVQSRHDLIDVTPLARHIGLLPPTAMTLRLWADLEAIPPGFDTETVHSRLTRVLQNAFLAVVEAGAPKNEGAMTEELIVFHVLLSTVGQEISDYPVVLRFRPGSSAPPTFILMAPEEMSSSRQMAL